MPDRDREKVIKAVEYLNWYFTQDDGAADKDAVEAWKELIREQEPVEPFHECCDGLYPRTLVSNKYFVFCPYCGRRVKWDDA